jgi:hypothetical protein
MSNKIIHIFCEDIFKNTKYNYNSMICRFEKYKKKEDKKDNKNLFAYVKSIV